MSVNTEFRYGDPGIVHWFTGLSGAGKTTIGSLFFSELRKRERNAVYLDGDIIRNVLGVDGEYKIEERKKLAMQYSRLCQMLSNQGIDVVIATISMFDEIRDWNRANIKNYIEIYLKVSVDILKQRDQKGLYSGAEENGTSDIIGLDLDFEEPKSPDFIIENDGSTSPQEIVGKLMKELH